MRFGFLFALILCVQGYLYWKIRGVIRRASLRSPTRRRLYVIAGLMAAYFCMAAAYMISGRRPTGPLPDAVMYGIVYPFWIWFLPSTFVLFPVLLLKDLVAGLVRGIAWLASKREPPRMMPAPVRAPAMTRRQFLRYSAAGAMAAPVVLSAYGAAYAARGYEVTRLSLSLPGLPSALSGFRIVQVSDIHSNLYMDYAGIREIVRRVNALPADLIVLTGDYVSNTARYIYPMIDAFKAVRTPDYGIYATLGNHDFYTDPTEITEALTSIDIPVLRNKTAVLTVRDSRLNLIGIDYGGNTMRRGRRGRRTAWPALSDLLDRAVQTAHPDGFDILLSHSPMGFDHAVKRRIPLTLSGHTHGGQIVLDLPGMQISPVLLLYPYISGLYRRDGGALYVNRGCGTTGPPIRLNCAPEITVITLQPAPHRPA